MRMKVQESVQRRSRRARCQQELQISGEPFCDERGTNRRVNVASKRFKQDDEDYNCATSVHFPPHTKCQLCCKPYKEPRILPCLQSFCEQCLHKEIERSGTKQNMECPTCQRNITIPEGGVNAIPRNLHLDFEVEVAGYVSKIGSEGEKSCDACIEGCTGPAVVFCCTCAHFLCKLCHDNHKRNKILQHHQIVGLDKESLKLLPSIMKSITKRLCSQPDHEKEELQLYCETCQLLVCRDCTLVFHKDHRIDEMCNIAKVHKDAMREALVCAQEVTSKLPMAFDANDKMVEQVGTSRENAMLIITQAFEQLHQTIEERKKALFSETHTNHEIVALGNQLPTELKLTLKKVENVFLTPRLDTLIKDLSIFGHVTSSLLSPSQSTWSSVSVAKVKGIYCVKVESMTSKGERYPYGVLQVKAELRPKSHDEAVIPGEVEDLGDGTYTITLTPQTAGPHQLLITMDGQQVQKSPCDLYVRRQYSTLCKPEQVINCRGGPSGIAIHDSGDIYVACIDDNCIHVFDQVGQQKRTIGKKGSGDGQFSGPRSIFIKGDVMYVADSDNNRIQKLTTGGQFLQMFRSGQGQFDFPISVIIDQRDRLIVADYNNHRVVLLDAAGTWIRTIDRKVHSFENPYGLALDPQGNIHVAAFSSNTINVFSPEGTYVRSYGHVKGPFGIENDEEGYSLVNERDDPKSGSLDVANCGANTVLKYTSVM
eukprot:Em0004g1400a